MAINKLIDKINPREITTQNQYLKTLLNTLSELIWVKDCDGNYLYCNDEFQLFFGATEAEILGNTDFDLVDSKRAQFFRDGDIQATNSKQAIVLEQWDSYAGADEQVYLKTTKTPMYNSAGELTGILGISHDITYFKQAEDKLRIANEELTKMAIIDALTNIANRRAFDIHLSKQWKQCRREQISLSLLILDIDFFKQYNDFYGHANGDKCLQQIGYLLRNGDYAKRPNDLVVRYGGEEFAIILSDSGSYYAFEIAERLRNDVMRLNLPHEATRVEDLESNSLTVSIGIASIIPSEDNVMKDLFDLADHALYQAKNMGRNQCYQTMP